MGLAGIRSAQRCRPGGTVILDVTDRDPAPGRGLDPAGLFSAVGIAAAVATAATGVVDWTVSDDEDRRVGLFHGVLNTAALGLQGASLAARLAGHRRTARGLGVASLTVTGAAAYLGGHLVFAKAVMVSRVPGADGPRRWVRWSRRPNCRTTCPPACWPTDGRSCCIGTTGPSTRSTTCAATPPVGIPEVPTLPVYACRIEGDAILVDIDQQLNDALIPNHPYH